MTRNTPQRQIILGALQSLSTHPTSEVLYEKIHEKYPSISKATVYRNLRQLAEIGLISQIPVMDEAARFDGKIENHYHFKCKNCGGIFDLDVELFQGLEILVSNKHGHIVDRHDIVLTGICIECNQAIDEKTPNAYNAH